MLEICLCGNIRFMVCALGLCIGKNLAMRYVLRFSTVSKALYFLFLKSNFRINGLSHFSNKNSKHMLVSAPPM